MSIQGEQLQNDLKLIQEVEKHSNLYDPGCKDKDSKSRDYTWSIIGKKLNLAPDACKNRWKNLRDKYTREKKLMMIEGEESYRSHSWPLLDEMSFLWNFVSHRNRPQLRIKNFSSPKHSSNYSLPSEWIETAINCDDCDYSTEKSNLDPACVLIEEAEPLETSNEDCSPPNSKLRRLLEKKEEGHSDSPFENLAKSCFQPESLALVKIPQQIRLMDEEEYFCMSLAASLRRLDKQKSSLLKIKIMQSAHLQVNARHFRSYIRCNNDQFEGMTMSQFAKLLLSLMLVQM